MRHGNAKRERSSGEQHTYGLSSFRENSPRQKSGELIIGKLFLLSNESASCAEGRIFKASNYNYTIHIASQKCLQKPSVVL